MLSAASLESKSISRTGRSRPLGPAVLFAIYEKFKKIDAQGITTRLGSGDLVTRAASEIITDPSARREAEVMSASEVAGSCADHMFAPGRSERPSLFVS